MSMKLASAIFRSPALYRMLGATLRAVLSILPNFLKYNRFNEWGKQRDLPTIADKSFRQLYKERHVEPR